MQVTNAMVAKALDVYVNTGCDTPAQAMRAALTAALAEMWRPIEEAEPNRTYLLGWRDWRDDKWCMEVAPACHGHRNEVANNMSWHGSATHFMPLPQPPAQKEVE